MNEDSRKRKRGKLIPDMIAEGTVPLSALVSLMSWGPRSENFKWNVFAKLHGVTALKIQQSYSDALLIRLRLFVEHVFNHMPPPESEVEWMNRLKLADMVSFHLENRCICDTSADVNARCNARCVIFLLCFMF